MGRGRRPSDDTLLRILFARYRYSAKKKRKSFTLSFAAFKRIVLNPCAYCGSPPSNVVQRRGGRLRYTGIDRVDNKKGYLPGNVFPCCVTCNRAKGRMQL